VGSRRPLTQVLFNQKEIQGFSHKDSGTSDREQRFRDKYLETRAEEGRRDKGLVT
jgi:hypothetical protein